MKYTLIIPVYNEAHRLNELIESFKILNENIEIIIVNDGSTDSTKEILKTKKKILKTFNMPINEGKGSAILMGLKNSSNKNIILMDGDLEIGIKELPKLINAYEQKHNHILVGIRWEKGEFETNLNYLGNLMINWVFNMLYKTKLNDILCCLKIIDTKTLKALDISSKGFSIESELMSKIVIKGIKITQKKVKYLRRSKSEGKKLKLTDAFVIFMTIFKTKIFYK